MPIFIDKKSKSFRMDTPGSSYCMQVSQYGDLLHTHYGGRISDMDLSELWNQKREFSPNPAECGDRLYSLDVSLQEVPGNMTGDYRTPSVIIKDSTGAAAVRFQYESFRVYEGKSELAGLPSSFCGKKQADTLEITLTDTYSKVKAVLIYTVFRDMDMITRSVRLINEGEKAVYIKKAASSCVEFADSRYELVSLPGCWAMERTPQRKELFQGRQVYESRRGASSHQMNPFLALVRPETNEVHGQAYGFSFVYSGNFMGEAEVSQYGTSRILLGIHPQDFTWKLETEEAFQTPEVVMTYTDQGLGAMSRNFHDFYRNHLCNPRWMDTRRPILINNWEATYFDFNSARLLEIGKEAVELGIEMLVIDDGWFGKREDDTSSLGDWVVNRRKLPEGLKPLVGKLREMGLKSGIWMEPEMVSKDSQLYRKHPEWCLHIEGRPCSTGRSQYVLDLARADVCEYLFEAVDQVLSESGFAYLKWDMNRHLTEVGSVLLGTDRQGEIFHRYVLGLYQILGRIVRAHPDVLIEGCSGGGGRFDPGMLYYCPQIWTSDDTDAGERMMIQYGTSMVYPPSAMGSHVSACPNHQTGRTVSLHTRGMTAMTGGFGYEMDLGKLSLEEKEEVKRQIEAYKQYAELIMHGDYFRLVNPDEGRDICAWEFVSKDKKKVLVHYVQMRGRANGPLHILQLQGLLAAERYQEKKAGLIYHGDTLMNAGLRMPLLMGDFQGYQFYLEARDSNVG